MRSQGGVTASSGVTGMRGRVAIFIDGNNLFHAARSAGVEIDYAKLLNFLRGESPLLRAFFYTGVDERAERQQGFLLWMRRNGFRVIHKELKTFYDGTRKANLDVEIAVDMLSLAGRYDTAVLVSGDEDFVYAVNAVAYKGCRVEVAGFRSNTAPKLIDVADYFIDLGEIADKVRKEPAHSHRYYENHTQEQPQQSAAPYANHGARASEGIMNHVRGMANGDDEEGANGRSHEAFDEPAPPPQLQPDPEGTEEDDQFAGGSNFVRVTDDQ